MKKQINCPKCSWNTGCSYIAPPHEEWCETDGTIVRCPMCKSYLKEPSNEFKKNQIKILKEKLKCR